MLDLQLLEQTRLEAAVCTRCPLHASRNRSVFHDGNPEARIMIIGEAPGTEENKFGTPFVGPAGQRLTQLLIHAGLDRDTDVYITNTVKCWPPGNRKPASNELDACQHFLSVQWEIIQPTIIILAGQTAVSHVLHTAERISLLRGKWIHFEQAWWIMCVYHPSYLLRSGDETHKEGSPAWLTEQDFREIKRKYDELLVGA